MHQHTSQETQGSTTPRDVKVLVDYSNHTRERCQLTPYIVRKLILINQKDTELLKYLTTTFRNGIRAEVMDLLNQHSTKDRKLIDSLPFSRRAHQF